MNTPGNHSCSCFDGYVNSGPNGTDVICIDIGKTFTQRMSLLFSYPFLFGCVSFLAICLVLFYFVCSFSFIVFVLSGSLSDDSAIDPSIIQESQQNFKSFCLKTHLELRN